MAKQPWDRMEGESDKAYRAFCLFRDAGADRTKVGVVRDLEMRPNYINTITGWAKQWDWDVRARQYDDYYLKQHELMIQEQYADLRMESRTMRQNIIDVLQNMLGQVIVKWRDDLTPKDLAHIANAARVIMDQSRIEFDDMPQHRKVSTDNKKLEVVYVDEQYED